jgi:hypothetical protein
MQYRWGGRSKWERFGRGWVKVTQTDTARCECGKAPNSKTKLGGELWKEVEFSEVLEWRSRDFKWL